MPGGALKDMQLRSHDAGTHSSLQDIPGMGPKRRQALLKHFGGLRGIKSAGVDELAKVNGISQSLAMKIVDFYQSD